MGLQDWRKKGNLKAHKPDAREFKDLFALADRNLADSAIAELSVDGHRHEQTAFFMGRVFHGIIMAAVASGYSAFQDDQ